MLKILSPAGKQVIEARQYANKLVQNSFENPFESIADIIIEAKGDIESDEISKRSGYPLEKVQGILLDHHFKIFIQQLLVRRHFGTVRFQELSNEIAYLLTNELRNRVSKKSIRSKLSAIEIIAILNQLQKTSNLRADHDLKMIGRKKIKDADRPVSENLNERPMNHIEATNKIANLLGGSVGKHYLAEKFVDSE